MKKLEQVLFYGAWDEGVLATAQKALHKVNVKTAVLPPEAYREKIGYLVGERAFAAAKAVNREPQKDAEGDFIFPHEVMVLHNLKGKRLDVVLKALKDADVPHINYKAVVTPTNMFWTLERLLATIKKEHDFMMNRNREEK